MTPTSRQFRNFAILAGLATLGTVVARALLRPRPARVLLPAPPGAPRVRDAGPEAMRDPPRGWSAVDEASDESFPASDPPGGY